MDVQLILAVSHVGLTKSFLIPGEEVQTVTGVRAKYSSNTSRVATPEHTIADHAMITELKNPLCNYFISATAYISGYHKAADAIKTQGNLNSFACIDCGSTQGTTAQYDGLIPRISTSQKV